MTTKAVVFIALIMTGCNLNSRMDCNTKDWFEIWKVDFDYTQTDTMWSGSNRSLVSYYRGSRSFLDGPRSAMVYFDGKDQYQFCGNRNFYTEGDRIFFYNDSLDYSDIAGGRFVEFTREGGGEGFNFEIDSNETSRFPIVSSENKVLFVGKDDDSLYVFDQSKFRSIDDFTMEGIYYIGYPGLSIEDIYDLNNLPVE